MPSIYFVIAKIESMGDSFAIKKIESDKELKISDKKFYFNNIEGSETIYIGSYQRSHETYEGKLEFHLKRYQTKINRSIYKIDLLEALGRIAYECDTLFFNKPVSENLILSAASNEEVRRKKLTQPIELTGIEKSKVNRKFQDIEESWLSYWKNSKTRLEAFYKKHPKPIKSQYSRSGLSSLIFGAFDKNTYDHDSYNHYQKLDWLCTKIAEESKELKIDFSIRCPGGCGKNTFFSINFGSESINDLYYLDENFPHGIYKKLMDVSGTCSECGTFSIAYDDEYTCLFRSDIPEIVYYVVKKIIKDGISYSIEKMLYPNQS
jgi:hypothetical protein